MPRQSRSSRPAARAPAPAAPSHQQTRSASTAASYPAQQPPAYHPSAAAAPPAVQQKQPGMLAQMAATAGSVAVGSTIGHGLSSMLFGGRSNEAATAPPPEPVSHQQQTFGGSCDFQAKEFTKCMESADINSCGWYLEQLKACQAAASRY
ncbi:hypothetical protein FRC02_007368 [Tulasnella sp. 418]|nr:hypothetical protein FRC02_007368 [Tulasnella sp. 418]